VGVALFEAAVGFRVKSGQAVAVLVGGSSQSPQVLDRRAIALCDSAVPESRQPYHAGMGSLETDAAEVEKRRRVVVQAANRSVEELLREYRGGGNRVRAASLVVGSETDPAAITNPHIRAHALEGQLFRTALEDALGACSLSCSVIVERRAYTQAAAVLKRPEEELRRAVAELGRRLGGPWRADEKTACLAGWLALARTMAAG
jgi:hypothetical protein